MNLDPLHVLVGLGVWLWRKAKRKRRPQTAVDGWERGPVFPPEEVR